MYGGFAWRNKCIGRPNTWSSSQALSCWDVIGCSGFASWILLIALQKTRNRHFYVILFHVCLQCFLCWLQEGHPACKKLQWWGADVVICLERDANLHMAQLMPLSLTVSCFSKIPIGSTFLVPADPGNPLNGFFCLFRVYFFMLKEAFISHLLYFMLDVWMA